MGRYGDAVAYLEKTLAADPKRKEAHGNIAYAYLKLGRRARHGDPFRTLSGAVSGFSQSR